MIVPKTVDEGVGTHLATVAKDENHSPDEQRQRVGKGMAMASSNILKCLNQHKNWQGYHFLGWRFQISMLRRD